MPFYAAFGVKAEILKSGELAMIQPTLYSAATTSYRNFSPVGDILVLAVSIVLIILLAVSFVKKDKGFRLFRAMLSIVDIAAMLNIIMHQLIDLRPVPVGAVYVLRFLYHLELFSLMFLFACYIMEFISLAGKQKRFYMFLGNIVLVLVTVFDGLGYFLPYGFRMTTSGQIHEGTNFFVVAYVFYVLLIIWLLHRFRERSIPPIRWGITMTFVFCVVLQGVQGMFRQMSFTTIAFMFPIIAFMFLLHSNPYNQETGAVNEGSFNNTMRDAYSRKRHLVLMSMHLLDATTEINFADEEMRFELFRFFVKTLRKASLFEVSGNRLIIVFDEANNDKADERVEALKKAFDALYDRFKKDFKSVFMRTDDRLGKNNDYVEMIEFMEGRTGVNNYAWVTEKDIDDFERKQFIVSQLRDIAEKMDLDDERVLAFCQPVYNVERRVYDTAEALMRLKLPEIGMVFPDQFIPVAEQYDLIHPLSLIILNKTCKAVKGFMESNLALRRISVNFSMQEVHDINFCEDIIGVIYVNEIPYDKIAIELTESRNDEDFELVKEKIADLKEFGIKFYLDDFGTGYSNMERIMELPFDIIKFDRSLVIGAGRNKDSEYMVNTFADMFDKLDYRVLFEGVEDESDERRCIRMYAKYLQGYKYSRPIPIEELRGFLGKEYDEAV